MKCLTLAAGAALLLTGCAITTADASEPVAASKNPQPAPRRVTNAPPSIPTLYGGAVLTAPVVAVSPMLVTGATVGYSVRVTGSSGSLNTERGRIETSLIHELMKRGFVPKEQGNQADMRFDLTIEGFGPDLSITGRLRDESPGLQGTVLWSGSMSVHFDTTVPGTDTIPARYDFDFSRGILILLEGFPSKKLSLRNTSGPKSGPETLPPPKRES